jgi:catechol 2,3-dioxygenase-like lactoylglutathione lyase family enzyme
MDATPEEPRQERDSSIYVMPAFITFACADVERTERWYVDGLGFFVLAKYPGLVHLRRWRYQDILLVPGAAAQRAAGVRYTVAAGDEDLPALAARAAASGGGAVSGPRPTPWNTVDLECVDPDGHVVVFTALDRARVPDPRFAERIRRGYDEARASERS